MKADLHIHSTFSDGLSSPRELVKAAIEKKIDCICLVDHGEIKGAIEAMRFAFDKNILVAPGIEISSKSGDILGVNVKKIIPDKLSAKQTVAEIRKQGGMAVIAHPFHWPNEGFLGGGKKILDVSPDAIEVFNASVLLNSFNKKAFRFAQRNGFFFSAGSDAHRAEFVGRGYLETFRDISSVNDLLEEIRNKRVKPGGNKLNCWEIYKNFSKTNIIKIIRSCFLRRRPR